MSCSGMVEVSATSLPKRRNGYRIWQIIFVGPGNDKIGIYTVVRIWLWLKIWAVYKHLTIDVYIIS